MYSTGRVLGGESRGQESVREREVRTKFVKAFHVASAATVLSARITAYCLLWYMLASVPSRESE